MYFIPIFFLLLSVAYAKNEPLQSPQPFVNQREIINNCTDETLFDNELKDLKNKINEINAQTASQNEKLQNISSCVNQLEQYLHNSRMHLQHLYERIGENEELKYLLDSVKYNFDYENQKVTCQICQQGNALDQIVNEMHCLQIQINNLKNAFPPPPTVSFYGLHSVWKCGMELLIWTVCESQLDFVIAGGPNSSNPLGSGAIGVLKSATFQWRPGFRIALDYTTCHNFWNILGQYTFFYSHGKNSTSITPPGVLNATFHQVVGPEAILALAESNIAFHYNIADILFSRKLQLAPAFLARLQMGGVGAWIRQDWKINHFPENGTGTGTATEFLNLTWNFQGGGLKAGAAFDWCVTKCWSLYTEANIAALVGWYKNRYKQQVFESGTVIDIPYDSKNYQTRFVETLQLRLGPCWKPNWRWCNSYLYALFEMNTWIGLQEVDRSFIANNPNEGRDSRHVEGFLGLYGVTIGASVSF